MRLIELVGVKVRGRHARFAAVALSGVVVGIAVACSPVATSANGACQSLLTCCTSAPAAEQASCAEIAATGVASSCGAELTSLTVSGACQSSSASGTGTGPGGGSGCSALAACCAAMPAASSPACFSVVSAGVATACTEELSAYALAGGCADVTGTGIGSGTVTAIGTGTGASSTFTGTGPESSSSTSTFTFSSSSSSGESSSSSTGPDTGSAVPPSPSGPPTLAEGVHNFAVHHLYFGDTLETPSFTASSIAWESIGYNLDGLDTTSATATNACTPYKVGSGVVDGENGIDNAFAGVVLGQLSAVSGQTVSAQASGQIADGTFTYLLDTTGLSSATQTNTGLGGQFFLGGAYGATPSQNGSSFGRGDNWPVSRASLANGSSLSGGAKVTFSSAYVSDGTWVSGTIATLPLSASFGGEALGITIHSAVITFQYTIDGSGQGHATNGVIAGVLETAELIAAFNLTVGQVSGGSECSLVGSVLVPLINGAQDLVFDESTGVVSNTPGTPCNAISIGIGFDADEIAPPSAVAPLTDAGTLMAACPQ